MARAWHRDELLTKCCLSKAFGKRCQLLSFLAARQSACAVYMRTYIHTLAFFLRADFTHSRRQTSRRTRLKTRTGHSSSIHDHGHASSLRFGDAVKAVSSGLSIPCSVAVAPGISRFLFSACSVFCMLGFSHALFLLSGV